MEQLSNVDVQHLDTWKRQQWKTMRTTKKERKKVSEQTSFSFHYFEIQLKISLLINKKPKNTNHKCYWYIFSIISPYSHKDDTCLRKTLQQSKGKHLTARNISYICIPKVLIYRSLCIKNKKKNNLKFFCGTRSWKEISSIHCIAFSNNRKTLLESYIDLSDLKWG